MEKRPFRYVGLALWVGFYLAAFAVSPLGTRIHPRTALAAILMGSGVLALFLTNLYEYKKADRPLPLRRYVAHDWLLYTISLVFYLKLFFFP